MVIVDVEHGDLAASALHDVVSSDGCVVEEAVAAVQVARRVVAGRAAQTVHRSLTAEHEVGRGHRRVDCCARRLVGAFGERRRGLEAPPAETRGDGIGFFGAAHLVAQLVAIKHVGHHFATLADNFLVFTPGDGQKVDQAFVVHRFDGVDAVVGGFTKREARVSLQRSFDGFGAAGVLER